MAAKEEGLAHFKAKENGCKFLVMSIVVMLGWKETATVEANRVNTIVELLGNDCSKGLTRGVSFKDELFGPIRGVKDG